jgi:hypothetical protein
MLHSSRGLGYLLAQVFLNHTIYADSRSHKKYTILYFPSIPGEERILALPSFMEGKLQVPLWYLLLPSANLTLLA